MRNKDADREGGYTLTEFKQIWLDINGSLLNPDKIVTVVEFECIGPGNTPIPKEWRR
jgi:hypothetical protein